MNHNYYGKVLKLVIFKV